MSVRTCTCTYILVHSWIHARGPYIPCIRIPGRGATYILHHVQGKLHTYLSSLATTLLRRIPDAPQPKIARLRHTATFQGATSMCGGREWKSLRPKQRHVDAFRFVHTRNCNGAGKFPPPHPFFFFPKREKSSGLCTAGPVARGPVFF